MKRGVQPRQKQSPAYWYRRESSWGKERGSAPLARRLTFFGMDIVELRTPGIIPDPGFETDSSRRDVNFRTE